MKVRVRWDDGVINFAQSEDLRCVGTKWRGRKPKLIKGERVKMWYLNKWFFGHILLVGRRSKSNSKLKATKHMPKEMCTKSNIQNNSSKQDLSDCHLYVVEDKTPINTSISTDSGQTQDSAKSTSGVGDSCDPGSLNIVVSEPFTVTEDFHLGDNDQENVKEWSSEETQVDKIESEQVYRNIVMTPINSTALKTPIITMQENERIKSSTLKSRIYKMRPCSVVVTDIIEAENNKISSTSDMDPKVMQIKSSPITGNTIKHSLYLIPIKTENSNNEERDSHKDLQPQFMHKTQLNKIPGKNSIIMEGSVSSSFPKVVSPKDWINKTYSRLMSEKLKESERPILVRETIINTDKQIKLVQTSNNINKQTVLSDLHLRKLRCVSTEDVINKSSLASKADCYLVSQPSSVLDIDTQSNSVDGRATSPDQSISKMSGSQKRKSIDSSINTNPDLKYKCIGIKSKRRIRSWNKKCFAHDVKCDSSTVKYSQLKTQSKINENLEECLDGVAPFIREVFKCENIRNGFNNEDLIFVLSLLPDIEEMSSTQKIIFQLKVVEILGEVFDDKKLQPVTV